MMKKTIKTLILIFIIMIILGKSSFGYEDELFEFDLPSNFVNMSYKDMYMFTDVESGGDRGFVIYKYENHDLKKSVWDIDDNDLKTLSLYLGSNVSVISTQKRAKLGKEKAIKFILKNSSGYSESYILASNNYFYIVMFIGTSTTELNNSDYMTIKDSFKLKDPTTNYNAVFTILGIIIVILAVIFKSRKNLPYRRNTNMDIDYKNMTEDDFNIKQ